ncbi:tetratricopeptide repeat protein [Mangrovibacterium sp.]|uniref:tetratricopeptide repeat-containing sensor histidine kinase n=1 Tax=Mangrovibacterium sp. TaxID=1961364 RepID=UPI003566A7B5
MSHLLLLLVILQINLVSAKTDSLESLLSEQVGEEKILTLLQLASQTERVDTVKCFDYIRESIAIATEMDRVDLIAKSNLHYAECLYDLGEYSNAVPIYEKAITQYEKVDSIEVIGEIYNSIGLSFYFLGEFENALESQIEAVKNFERTSDLNDLARIYCNMGMVYSQLADYDSSIQYYQKAGQIAKLLGDNERIGNSNNGVGNGHYDSGRLDSAKIYYLLALKKFKQEGNDERVAAVINNLGNIYTEEGDSLDVALSYYGTALKIYEKYGNLRNQVYVMEGLGCLYCELGQYDKALEIFETGVNIAKKEKFGFYIIQLYYKDMAQVYEKTGQIEKAYATYKTYKTYLDSLHQEERSFQAAAIEKKYEFSKKEALISKLNTDKELAQIQLEKDKAFRNLGIFAILILLVIVTYVSFGNYNRRKINKVLTQKNIQIEAQRYELEQLNASKNKFFSIIAHDLKNPLHTVLGYSYLLHHEYERFEDKEKKRYARDIYHSTNNIFRLLQNLLDWSRSQTGRLKYEPIVFELSSLHEKISNLLRPAADLKRIQLNYRVPGNIYVFATPMMIETVMRNLVSNAIKFTPPGGSVFISFSSTDNEVSFCVRDTGIGMTSEELTQLFSIDSKIRKKGTNNEDGSGLGLVLCKEFVQLNKGRIWAESQSGVGSTFCFTIPLAAEKS